MRLKRTVVFIFIVLYILLATYSYGKVLTLKQAIQLAINNNYLIKAQEENLKAAKSKYLSAVSNMFPKISFSYSYLYLKHEPYAIVMNRKMLTGKKESVEWFLRLSQPLFTGFALSTEKEIAKLGIDLNKIYKKEAVLDIALDTKLAYLNILLLEKQLDVAKEAVKQLKSHLKDAKEFYKEQLIPLDDLLKSKVALANAIQNKIKVMNTLKIAKSNLNFILSENIDSNFSLKNIKNIKNIKEPINKKPYNLKTLYKEASNNNPLISELKIKIEQARLGKKLAKSSYYPHLSLFVEYQQQGNNILASNNDFGNQHNSIIGLQINWQIFDSFKTHYDSEELEHRIFALKEKMSNDIQEIRFKVKKAYLNLKTALANIKTARVALEEAKENYRITNTKYKNQMATSTDVLDARTYLTQAEENYYNSLYSYYMAKAKLERALGKY